MEIGEESLMTQPQTFYNINTPVMKNTRVVLEIYKRPSSVKLNSFGKYPLGTEAAAEQ